MMEAGKMNQDRYVSHTMYADSETSGPDIRLFTAAVDDWSGGENIDGQTWQKEMDMPHKGKSANYKSTKAHPKPKKKGGTKK